MKTPRKKECQLNTDPVNNTEGNSLCYMNNFSEVQAEHMRTTTENKVNAPKKKQNKQKLCVLVDLYWADATICIAKM